MPKEDTTHAPPKPRSGWSTARRAKHAAAIRRWKPWEKSTGPRSATGKAKSAQNAFKHGRHSLERRLASRAFTALGRCIRLIALYRRLWSLNPRNELLPRLHAHIRKFDRIFHVCLSQALERERLCKNLAFSPPVRQIVNGNDNRNTQFSGFQQTRKTNPRGGRHVGRGGFIRHGGIAS